MPKAGKTHKWAQKRFKKTGTGKLKHNKSRRRHLLTNKGNATHRDKFWKLLKSKKEAANMNELLQ